MGHRGKLVRTIAWTVLLSMGLISLASTFSSQWALSCPELSRLELSRPTESISGVDVMRLVKQYEEVHLLHTNTKPTFVMAVHGKCTDTEDPISSSLLQVHTWNKWVLQVFEQVLPSSCRAKGGGLVVDVGGNIGFFTTYAAMLGCKVVTFEPQPKMADFLRFSVHANAVAKHVTLFEGAASDVKDNIELRLSPKGHHAAYVGQRPTDTEITMHDQPVFKSVPTFALDDVIGANERVRLMKIDVEGGEYHVLRSASQLLAEQRVDYIVTEFNPSYLGFADSLELLKLVDGAGYTVRVLDKRVPDGMTYEEGFELLPRPNFQQFVTDLGECRKPKSTCVGGTRKVDLFIHL